MQLYTIVTKWRYTVYSEKSTLNYLEYLDNLNLINQYTLLSKSIIFIINPIAISLGSANSLSLVPSNE